MAYGTYTTAYPYTLGYAGYWATPSTTYPQGTFSTYRPTPINIEDVPAPDSFETKTQFSPTIQDRPRVETVSSNAEKLNATVAEANRLFSGCKTKADLLNAAQEITFRDETTGKMLPLKIYDGSQPGNEWVNKACKAYNGMTYAFFHVPESRKYDAPPAQFTKDNFPQEYIDVLTELSQSKTPAIFVRSNSPKGVLQHELFHALQYANGLPMGTTKSADDAMQKFRNDYNHSPFGISFIDQLWQVGKRALTWMFVVPYLSLKWALSKPPQLPPNTISVGEALRVNMDREIEVDKAQLRDGKQWGLSFWDRLNALQHYLFESKLQHIRSHWMDNIVAPES